MKRMDRKSHCPINFALEMFGDPWSLLILRDIVYFGKKTYGEFLGSEERIATNTLATRLVELEQKGIIEKCPCDFDGRKDVYQLTQKGRDLIPVLVEMSLWSAQYDEETDAPPEWIDFVNANKTDVTECMCQTVSEGGSVFIGDGSVVRKMAQPVAAITPSSQSV